MASQKWNQVDLEARLCKALDVARQTLEQFAVGGYTDEECPVFGFGPEKPAAETAMLIYAASPFRDRLAISSRIDQLADTLSPLARSERVCLNIALHPTLALKFAVPHILLRCLGFPDKIFDAFLKSCMASEIANGQDRSQSAAAEKRWILSLWSGRSTDRVSRKDLVNSILRWPLDIIGGLRDDAYAFTHLLMYSTDFGFCPCPLPRRKLIHEAASLLVRYVDLEDYDLSGEILLTWPLTGAPWSAASAFVFRVLTYVEDQVGILPCGNINPKRLKQLRGEKLARYALGTAYHTAYVMGFLCAASLRAGRMPPTKITGTQYDRACLKRLLDYVREDQGHWQSVFSSLTDTEQSMLVPFTLDVAIMQSCRRHDYRAASEILAIAASHHIYQTAMAHQVVGLLRRVGAWSTVLDLRAETCPSQSGGPSSAALR